MVCVEAFPKARYAPYIYRTRDFVTWEIGLHNPILWISKEDRMIKAGVTFDEETTKRIHSYLMPCSHRWHQRASDGEFGLTVQSKG